MVAGQWYNQDGLLLNYGTEKQIPEIGGDYLVYGETREIEQYVAFVPTQWGLPTTAGISPFTVAALPTSFVGNTTSAAAGIQSLTTFMPLQGTLPVGLTSGTIILNTTQLFLEEVTTETLIGAAGGTSFTLGLVTTSQLPGAPNATFVQVTPNAGVQLINGQVIARHTTAGQRTSYTTTTGGGLEWEIGGTAAAGAGAWMGNMPLVTNAITPLPQSAWLSGIATGTYTSGLIKVRVRYTMYGNISY